MSPRNLILMSLLTVLVTAARTAPVEEAEEGDLTEEAENDLSEENEDDDESAKKAGPPGAHQSTAGSTGGGPDAPSAHDVSGDRGAAGPSRGTADTSADYDSHSNGEHNRRGGGGATPLDFNERYASAEEQKQMNGRGGAQGTAGRGEATGVSHALFLPGGHMSLEGGASQVEYTAPCSQGTEETLEHRFPLQLGEESLTEPDVLGHVDEEAASELPPTSAAPEIDSQDSSPSSLPLSQQAGRDWSQENGNGRQTQFVDKNGVTAGRPSLDAGDLPATVPGTERNGLTATPADLSTLAPETTHQDVFATVSSSVTLGQPAGDDMAPSTATLTWHAKAVTAATDSLFSEATGTSLNSSGGPASREPPEAAGLTCPLQAGSLKSTGHGVKVLKVRTLTRPSIRPSFLLVCQRDDGVTFFPPTAAEYGDADDTC
ncbi:uncharacterized protein LOC144067474 [Stigmatopora argus]